MRCKFGLLVMLGLIALVAGQAGAVGLVNGSFEDGSYTGPDSFMTLNLNDQPNAIAGWTVIPGTNVITAPPPYSGIDWVNNYWTAFDGKRSLDLDDLYASGGVQQVLHGTQGFYQIGFEMAGNWDGDPQAKQMLVSAIDASNNAVLNSKVYTFTNPGNSDWKTNMGWQSCGFNFTATSPNTILMFQSMSTDTNAFGAALDNVSVVSGTFAPVPEPVTMVSAFIAISGLGAYIRRRTRVTA